MKIKYLTQDNFCKALKIGFIFFDLLKSKEKNPIFKDLPKFCTTKNLFKDSF